MATALITGASNGIGLELAKIHAQKGDNLVLVARSGEKLKALEQTLSKQYKITVHVIASDLSNSHAPEEIYAFTKQAGIKVDYLINNAGFGDFGLFHESDWNKQSQMINLNITSLTHLARLYLPEMVARKHGKIMNVASTAANTSALNALMM